MFKTLTVQRRLLDLESENLCLKAENDKLRADSDYIAMMTDVELGEDDENEQEV